MRDDYFDGGEMPMTSAEMAYEASLDSEIDVSDFDAADYEGWE